MLVFWISSVIVMIVLLLCVSISCMVLFSVLLSIRKNVWVRVVWLFLVLKVFLYSVCMWCYLLWFRLVLLCILICRLLCVICVCLWWMFLCFL